jgi:Zn-dependent protease with chaperone function
MTSWLAPLALWAADYYALATPLLGLAALAVARETDPARRMGLARAAAAGLFLLAALVAAPIGPRVDLGLWSASDVVGGADSAEWSTRFGAAFLVGTTVVAAWLVLGAIRALRLLGRSREAPACVRALLRQLVGGRPPRVRTNDRLAQPVALGICRPTIVLPDALETSATRGQLTHLLRHEWAHIRNGDLWLLAITRLLLVVLFAHPLYWWLRGRIRDDQELLADAAAAGDAPVEYARTLLHWSRTPAQTPGGALAFAGRPSRLKRRLAALLDPAFGRSTASSGGWQVGIGCVVLCLVLLLSALTLRQTSRPAAGPALAVATPLPTLAESPPPLVVRAAAEPPAETAEFHVRIQAGVPFAPPDEKTDLLLLSPHRSEARPAWMILWFLWGGVRGQGSAVR